MFDQLTENKEIAELKFKISSETGIHSLSLSDKQS